MPVDSNGDKPGRRAAAAQPASAASPGEVPAGGGDRLERVRENLEREGWTITEFDTDERLRGQDVSIVGLSDQLFIASKNPGQRYEVGKHRPSSSAIYAGSFDPPTLGHLWMIERGAELFDKLIVAIGINTGKEYSFTLDERLSMLKELARERRNVSIESFENQFLVKYAKSKGVKYVLRGIRNEADYAYERGMRLANSDIEPSITTVFLMPPREMAEISSSFIKGLVGSDGWQSVVGKYLPPSVASRFINKFSGRHVR
jgi:pantetheine-phosphate adenylyltransferase